MEIATPIFKTTEDCISFAENVNSAKQPLTIEMLRSFPGCEHYTDEEAASIIQTIEQLSLILFECMPNSICIDNEQVVYLEQERRLKTKSIKDHLSKTQNAAA
jgi:hypothetical protein